MPNTIITYALEGDIQFHLERLIEPYSKNSEGSTLEKNSIATLEVQQSSKLCLEAVWKGAKS